MTENLNNHIDTKKNLDLPTSYRVKNDETAFKEAKNNDLAYDEAEENEPGCDERLISSQLAYLKGHFPNRDTNFEWSVSEDAIGSKIYADSIGQPAVIVSSWLQDDAIVREVNIETYLSCQVKDDDTSEGDHKEESWLRELVGVIPADDPDDRYQCHIFFHELGMAARCRKRGTAFIFDVRGFLVFEYPSGGVSYVGCHDGFTLDNSYFFMRVCHEESGGCHITLSEETERDMETSRESVLNLIRHLLEMLSGIAATLRKVNL